MVQDRTNPGAPVTLFNTLGRRLTTLAPLQPPEVRVYTCGPTVYDYAHIGNLRAYLFADLLRHVLAASGYVVRQVASAEYQVQTTKTPKCTFSGVVPIEARRFLDSGTRLVECPDCAAMRSLDLQKGVLRFKSHDRRKTTTPNTEERWVRVDLVWDVVGG